MAFLFSQSIISNNAYREVPSSIHSYWKVLALEERDEARVDLIIEVEQ